MLSCLSTPPNRQPQHSSVGDRRGPAQRRVRLPEELDCAELPAIAGAVPMAEQRRQALHLRLASDRGLSLSVALNHHARLINANSITAKETDRNRWLHQIPDRRAPSRDRHQYFSAERARSVRCSTAARIDERAFLA